MNNKFPQPFNSHKHFFGYRKDIKRVINISAEIS